MEDFREDKPVKLLRVFVSKSGNTFYPGIYNPGELPKKAYTSYYIVQEIEEDIPEVKEAVKEVKMAGEGKFETSEVKVSKGKPGSGLSEEVSIKTRPSDNISLKATQTESKPNGVKVNSVDLDTLQGLPGISEATAKKVIRLREKSAFTDYRDLNERVNLPFGKDWTSIEIDFNS
jgi:DNA uptake protein ComE-like DNA-binding protein